MKNDYYVYLHLTPDERVFYVGKGRKGRAYSKYNRGNNWAEVANNGFTVHIVKEHLTETEALDLEAQLISEYIGIVNYRTVSEKIDYSNLNDYFKIDHDSPSGISRIKQTWTGKRFVGNLGPVGHVRNRNGKSVGWEVKFKNQVLVAHRIVWGLEHGKIPDHFLIDHIDGNPLNNHPSNLRCVPANLNNKNKKIYKNNKTSCVGVYIRDHFYVATWKENEKSRSKRFSTTKYGNEDAFRLACEYRAQKIRELNEQGAGYTERHGT